MRRALILAALLALVVVVPAEAKKPVTATATVTTDATVIHAGDVVTFTATTDAPWWKHEVRCYQSGTLVMLGGWRFFPAGTYSYTFTLTSPAYEANPIGADCEVWVAQWVGFKQSPVTGTVLVPEPYRFTLLP